MSGKNESPGPGRFKLLTLAFLFDVIEIKETIRFCSGLKSAVIYSADYMFFWFFEIIEYFLIVRNCSYV